MEAAVFVSRLPRAYQGEKNSPKVRDGDTEPGHHASNRSHVLEPVEDLSGVLVNGHVRQKREGSAEDERHVGQAPPRRPLEDLGRIAGDGETVYTVLMTVPSSETEVLTECARARVKVTRRSRPRRGEQAGVDDLLCASDRVLHRVTIILT